MSDLISRKDAIELLKNDMENNGLPYDDDYNIGINHAMCLLACVPTAEPKVGEWIDTGENLHKCSNCGQIIFSQTPYDLEMFHAYCGRCGAKMERSE